MKMAIASIAAAALAAQTQGALAQTWHHGWDSPMGWGGWWMGPFGWIIGILVIGLLITGLWRLFRGQPSASETGQPDRALDILRERFARGEINEDEFEARKNALGR